DVMAVSAVIADEPEWLSREFGQFWARVEEAHERSEIGNLVKPDDLYLGPEDWLKTLQSTPGAEIEHLGLARSDDTEQVEFHSQPAPRFHGSIPKMLEEVKKQVAENRRILVAAPNTGELERLADFFTEYGVSYRLGSRTRGGESY